MDLPIVTELGGGGGYRWWGGNCPDHHKGASHCVATAAHRCSDITWAGENPAARSRAVDEERRRYTRIIANCGKKGRWPQALATVLEMRRRGVEWDGHVCDTAVLACINSARYDVALEVMGEVEKSGFTLEEQTYNELISACGRAEQWQHSLDLLNKLLMRGIAPQVEAYNCVVRSCQRNKQWVVILKVLLEMEQHSIRHHAAAQDLRKDMSQQLPSEPWQRWEQFRAQSRPQNTEHCFRVGSLFL
ncbi:unnamed protein product [Polarella glacialis]|uniref:Pentacotripeptide-repeat region of PRORP domain-containing protein n=1 Tax=Polarella glacialis TaxID=89957 RepID=A0A813JDM8_POLGL|nr:unnamed protein product [Polarella glacialis]